MRNMRVSPFLPSSNPVRPHSEEVPARSNIYARSHMMRRAARSASYTPPPASLLETRRAPPGQKFAPPSHSEWGTRTCSTNMGVGAGCSGESRSDISTVGDHGRTSVYRGPLKVLNPVEMAAADIKKRQDLRVGITFLPVFVQS